MIDARPFAAADAARAERPGVARRSGGAPAAARARRGRQGRPLLIVDHRATRGSCGSFNSNIIKAARQFIARRDDADRDVALGLIGRKGRDFFRRRGFEVALRAGRHLPEAALRATRSDIARRRDRGVHSRARSTRSTSSTTSSSRSCQQRIVVEQLLPIPRLEVRTPHRAIGRTRSATVDYLYEPSPQEIFDELLPRYVEIQVYRALLESNAAFYAAQMTAMDTATQELGEMIDEPDALHEQGAAGGDHPRDHRGRVGSRKL